ncbi:MAG: hypothetical protein LBD29_00630, partial [Treponema sp.]|nr:hypothetical protein [Treponema sp.]
NSIAFIKPLHQKGIQVLVEVRSGNFTENHEGIGLGLGTLDIPGINQLIEEFKILIKQYGIDGFEFNDIGGGKTAYSPDTKNIKQFRSDNPLYDESLFKDENGDALTSDEIAAVLWREGGSNLSNLIQMTNESLKETYTTPIVYEENEIREVRRSVLVRDTGHGSKLLSQLRMAYMPDAYSGADPKVQGNLKYIVHGVPYEYRDHASLYDEAQNRDFGEDADNQYAPFTVDLRDKKPSIITNLLIDNFVGTFDNPNRYGGLYFINLPPVSEDSEILDYVSRFSMGLFGRRTTLREVEGAGDYRKTW